MPCSLSSLDTAATRCGPAMRHADARTTTRYDMARANLDRHAAHAVAAYLAGMATG